jgi:hypothetical protein
MPAFGLMPMWCVPSTRPMASSGELDGDVGVVLAAAKKIFHGAPLQ